MRRPRRARSAETRWKSSTIGAADGSIIAAIIVTQTPTYHPSEPRSVPGPASIPRILAAVTIQVASAAAISSVTTVSGRSRPSGEPRAPSSSMCGQPFDQSIGA
jgi:hypothetical protein